MTLPPGNPDPTANPQPYAPAGPPPAPWDAAPPPPPVPSQPQPPAWEAPAPVAPQPASWDAPPPPPPAPYAAGYPGYGPAVVSTPKPGMNGFAIASFVLSFCGGVFLSVIFGIVALVQTKKTGQRGRGFAIAGLSISAVWVLAIAIGVVVAIANSAERDTTTGQVTEAGTVALEKLRAGDCVEEVDTSLVTELTVVPCSQPHHAEVYAVFALSGSTFPGDSSVEDSADTGCDSRLKTYSATAYDDDAIDIYYFTPTRQTWATGDKNIICIASDDAKKRTGSLKD